MLGILKESIGLIAALIMGIITYTRMNRMHKLLFYQMLSTIALLIFAQAIISYQRVHGLPLNNLWLHNIYIFIEMGLLLLALNSEFSSLTERLSLFLSALVFTGVWIYDYHRTSSLQFLSFSFIVQSIILVLLYSWLMYRLLHAGSGDWKHRPEVWMCLGVVLYFAVNIPYMSLMNKLNQTNLEVSRILEILINDVLSNLRYLLLALGFRMLPPLKTKIL